MKKLFSLVITLALVLALAACGTGNSETSGSDSGSESKKKKELTTLKVGATPVPHAEILEKVQPILKDKGIKLKIKEFNNYVIPNKALNNGSIDANFFQHIPYLESQKEKHGYNFVSLGKVHLEPIGIYSKKYDSLKDLPKGAKILVSSAPASQSRILKVFADKGIIELKDGVGYSATFDDITSNPKNLKFEGKYDAAMLPTIYKNGGR